MTSIVITEPPARRSDTPIKPVFRVPSLETLRSVVDELGGALDVEDAAWTWKGLRRLDALDPEGNVVRLCEPVAG